MMWEPNAVPSSMNISEGERRLSSIGGALLLLVGLSRRSLPGMIVALLGGLLIYRGLTGRSELYRTLGVNTAVPATPTIQTNIYSTEPHTENIAVR
jgi:uncharacterized membrane protein